MKNNKGSAAIGIIIFVILLGILGLVYFVPKSIEREDQIQPQTLGVINQESTINGSTTVGTSLTEIITFNTGRTKFSVCPVATTTSNSVLGIYVAEFAAGVTPTSTQNASAATFFSSSTGRFVADGDCYDQTIDKYLSVGSIWGISASTSIKVATQETTGE